MKLSDYLALNAIKQKDFAETVGERLSAINKYCLGLRIPRPSVMAKIYAATGGSVDANSFFDLPSNSPAVGTSVDADAPAVAGENAALTQNIVAPSVNMEQGERQ